jgi:AraC-like DNA-binding protein
MAVFIWQQKLDPEFPLAVLEYTTGDGEDRMHWHDHLEIALVLQGRGRFLFGRREHPAEPGDVFFIDNSQPHVAVAGGPMPAAGQAGSAAGDAPGARNGGRADGQTGQERARRSDPDGAAGRTDAPPLRLLLILFRPELVAGPGCRSFDAAYLSPFRAGERAFPARIPGGTPLARELAAAIEELRAAWDRRDPADRHLLDATLRRVLGLVIRDRAGDGATARSAADRREQIRPVLAYVEGHCRESITLDDVAEVVHVSPSRVRHVFKDVTGVGFKEYVTHVRVAEAKRLLLSTDLSVADIARAVSYTNLHQFYRVFHRSCAMCPGEYRRYYTPAGMGGV